MNNSLTSQSPSDPRTSVLLGLQLHPAEPRHQNSAGSIADLSATRISVHGGTLVQSSGELLLAEFEDAAEAVNCAIDLQERFARRDNSIPDEPPLKTRIGIHFGESYLSDGVCHGQGVEVLKELLASIPASSIYMTRDVFVRVRLLLPLKFERIGKRTSSASNDEKEVFSVGWESVTENLKASLKRLDQDDLQRATRLSSKLGIDTSIKGSPIVLILFALFLFVLLKVLKFL